MLNTVPGPIHGRVFCAGGHAGDRAGEGKNADFNRNPMKFYRIPMDFYRRPKDVYRNPMNFDRLPTNFYGTL